MWMRSLDPSRAKALRDCAHTRPPSTATVTVQHNMQYGACGACSHHRHSCMPRASRVSGRGIIRSGCDAPIVTYQVWRQLCIRQQFLWLFSSLKHVITCLFSTATCEAVINSAVPVLAWITWHWKEGARVRWRSAGSTRRSRVARVSIALVA